MMSGDIRWAIAIHGGAGVINADTDANARALEGLQAALTIGLIKTNMIMKELALFEITSPFHHAECLMSVACGNN
jgi:hypothetical protein